MENNKLQVINTESAIATTVANPVEIVNQMSMQQVVDTLTIIKLWTKKSKDKDLINFEQALENRVYASTLDGWDTQLNDGSVYNSKIVRAKETETKVKTKKLNWQKAIEYAKANGKEIPMTPRQIIEPQVDYVKLEAMPWFREMATQFYEVVEETKTTKSSNSIRTNKEVK